MNAEAPVDLPQSIYSHGTTEVVQCLSHNGSRSLHKHVAQVWQNVSLEAPPAKRLGSFLPSLSPSSAITGCLEKNLRFNFLYRCRLLTFAEVAWKCLHGRVTSTCAIEWDSTLRVIEPFNLLHYLQCANVKEIKQSVCYRIWCRYILFEIYWGSGVMASPFHTFCD
jgi:hypothetical protein